MTTNRRLVLDANILIRAVLGTRVYTLVRTYSDTDFVTTDVCKRDAEVHIVSLAYQRFLPREELLMRLETILQQIQVLDAALYAAKQSMAESRLAARDIEDWPILATALVLDCPIWTEDQDFFGSGVATWTTRNVELYLRDD